MRKLIVLLFLTVITMTDSFGGPAGIWKGRFMKVLPNDGMEFKDVKKVHSGAVDPSGAATDGDQGSLYLFTTKLLQKQDGGSTTNWLPFLLGPAGSGTDECVTRWDGTAVPLLQDSIFCITDAGIGTGLIELAVTNIATIGDLTLSGNTISSATPGNNIILDPAGSGGVQFPDLTASRPLKLDATNIATAGQIDLASANDVSGVLPIENGGTNSSSVLNDDRVIVSSGGSLVELAALLDGELVIGVSGGAPVTAALLSTVNQTTIATAPGSITIGTAQDIHVGATPTFVNGEFTALADGEYVKTVVGVGLTTIASIPLDNDVIGVLPIANGGTNSSTALNSNRMMISSGGAIVESTAKIQGSILFAGAVGLPAEDNTKLFWDNTNNRLGIGINTPSTTLQVKANTPGTVGDNPAGQIIIQALGTSLNANAVLTGYNSDGSGNPNNQLWYWGSSSGSNSNVTLLNRINASLALGTNNITRLNISGGGLVSINSLTASQFVKTDASKNLISSASIDLTSDVSGLLPNSNGGTGIDSSASTGLAKVSAGTWSFSSLVNADVDAAAAIALSKLSSTGPLDVDNLRLSGNALISTNANGEVQLDPNGIGPISFESLSAGQVYHWNTTSTDKLSLQGQSSATNSGLYLFASDGDGSDLVDFTLFGLGTPTATTNTEGLQFRFNTSSAPTSGDDDYEIVTAAGGSGTVRPIEIRTGANANQLRLETDGDVAIGASTATEKLDVNGSITTRAAGGWKMQDSTGGEAVTLLPPSTISTSYNITFPTAQGAANQVLVNDGVGQLNWQNETAGSGFTMACEAVIVGTIGCAWTGTTGSTFADFSTDTDCPGPTILFDNSSGTCATTDTDLPEFTLTSAPAGNYKVTFCVGTSLTTNGSAELRTAWRITDGTNNGRGFSLNINNNVSSQEEGKCFLYYFEYAGSATRTWKMQSKIIANPGSANISQTEADRDFYIQVEHAP